MDLKDKIKKFIMGSEEDEEFGEVADYDYEENDDVQQSGPYQPMESFESSFDSGKKQTQFFNERNNKVVNFASASNNTERSSNRPHVVVAKLEKFEDVGEVAKNINEKRMVIINLQDADNPTTQRIIDFIYGVAIANKSELKRIAFRTYIIKPQNYDYTGSDGFDSNNMDGIIFGK